MISVFLLLCGLCGATANGTEAKGKLGVPSLDLKARQLVLEANNTLELNCRGRGELSWAFPASLAGDHERIRVRDWRCGKQSQQYCSRLTVSAAQAQHTGSFQCRYHQRPRKQSSVYVYVTDRQQPFVEMQAGTPDVLRMKEGQPLVFPCRVTHPNATVSLVKFPDQKLTPDKQNIVWNSKQGFIIRIPTYVFIGLFSCETSVDGVPHSSKYLTLRLVNKIIDVYLNSTGPVQALKGDRLALNCTVTAEWNVRVSFSWLYPGQASGVASITRKIYKSDTHMVFYSVLSIPKLSRSDRGLYTCLVTSGPHSRETKVNVTVYDRPFIRLKARQGVLLEAKAGQKSYRLTPKLRAFPSPEVIWLKDGMVAAERCSRYHKSGNSLVIRDVAEEDAGKYTILVGIQEHGLYQNLTLTLVVNVSPQIGEKAVSVQDPGTVLQGSRQALHCTSHAVPPSSVQWLWHHCPPRDLCVSPKSPSVWTPVGERAPGTATQNHILSVTNRQEVLQGKNKTVGVLTVAEAFVSGIYRCIASNSVGKDELDIRFYITDVAGGFEVRQEEDTREGRDLQLTCVANKYLYGQLAWQRVTARDRGPAGSGFLGPAGSGLLGGQLSLGAFSNTLRLLLSNLTAADSGTYRCSARHLQLGKDTHLDAHVDVTVLEAPVLLQNLSDCSVNVSSSVTLRCPAQGVPPPTLTWYKDQLILWQGSGIVIVPEGGHLHIDRITMEDQGLYTCQATNERGSAESSAYISVNGVPESSWLEIPTLTCTCVVATVFWLMITLFIRKLKQSNTVSGKTEYLSIMLDAEEGPVEEQADRLHFDPGQWEFPREHLKLGNPLGRGAFGKVMQASAFGIDNSTGCKTVAVKMLKEGATDSEHKALMTELKILNHIGHHLNVVNLLGACTRPGGPVMVIVEYCRFGNLSTYLKSKREAFVHNSVRVNGEADFWKMSLSSSQSSLSSGFEEEGPQAFCSIPLFLEDLISFSFQVARGMEFLASRKCIHRDLAARNILLSQDKVVKICDFGLARDLYKDPDYIRKGDARLPLKWMSPEAIFDKVFTTQSDVWSYGVLLWEIFSLGSSPYPGLHIDEEFCHRLKEGVRMRAPEYSTPAIYSTMLACWEANPLDRPTFTELVGTLGDLLQAQVQRDGKDYIPLGTLMVEDVDYSERYTESHSTGLQTHAVTNLSYMRSVTTLQTFEDLRCTELAGPDDEQCDSGMVLPSEELKHLTWSSGSKSSKLSRFSKYKRTLVPCLFEDTVCSGEKELPALPCGCGNPGNSTTPDYKAALLHPAL